jgi:hypothetical protein
MKKKEAQAHPGQPHLRIQANITSSLQTTRIGLGSPLLCVCCSMTLSCPSHQRGKQLQCA